MMIQAIAAVAGLTANLWFLRAFARWRRSTEAAGANARGATMAAIAAVRSNQPRDDVAEMFAEADRAIDAWRAAADNIPRPVRVLFRFMAKVGL